MSIARSSDRLMDRLLKLLELFPNLALSEFE